MVGEAMFRQPTWLEMERQEGVVKEAGRPAPWVVNGAGVRAFMVPMRW